MNEPTRFDKLLTGWLEEDGPQDVPQGVLDAALDQARSVGQVRGPWSLADLRLSARLALYPVPRVFVYAALLLLLLLALAGATLLVASTLHRLPPPIGPATNGLIVDDSDGRIFVMERDGSDRRALTPESEVAQMPVFSPDGTHIAFVTWEVVDRSGATDVGPRGSVVVIRPDGSDRQTVAAGLTLTGWPPSWSHDSARLAVAAMESDVPAIYVYDLPGTRMARIPNGDTPSWSPDDRAIAYARPGDGVYVAAPDGSGIPRRLSSEPGFGLAFLNPRWSPDGRRLAYVAGNDNAHSIWVVSRTGGDDRQIVPSAFDEFGPSWSPDGHRLVFARALGPGGPFQETRWHPVVALADATGEAREYTDADIDWTVRWSPDGRFLIGSGRDRVGDTTGKIDVVSVDGGAVRLLPGSGAADWQRLAP